jgi:GTP cyclohydrolase I
MLALKRSLSNREKILVNVLKTLASIVSMCSHHVILFEDYTKIFYMLSRSHQLS